MGHLLSANQPCPIPLAQSLAALRQECLALDPIIDDLPQDLAAHPTPLEDFTLQVLVAHLARGMSRFTAYLTLDIPSRPSVDWLGYWRAAAIEADPAGIARRARQYAAEIEGRPVPTVWRESWQRGLQLADAASPDRLLPAPFGAMRLDHYATSRVVEATVHGLDLRAALGLEQVATPAGLGVTTAVLEGLLPGARPEDLADDVPFVLSATGRRPHPDPRLPVLQ